MFFSHVHYNAPRLVFQAAGRLSAALTLSVLVSTVGAQPAAGPSGSVGDPAFGSLERFTGMEDKKPAIHSVDFLNPYRGDQFDDFLSEGLRLQEAGDHESAVALLQQAWQMSRIDLGLYHEAQIPILKSIVYSQLELENYAAVDQRYDYLTHLYRRLYSLTDPRLEAGLQQISSFYIAAFNINLEGRQEYHLRKAAELLNLRQEAALLTLESGHPKLEFLEQSIELSKQHLYLLSDKHRELRARQAQRNRDRLFASLE